MAGPRVAPGAWGGVVLRPLFIGGRKAMPGEPIAVIEADTLPPGNRRALEAAGKVRWFEQPATGPAAAPISSPRGRRGRQPQD